MARRGRIAGGVSLIVLLLVGAGAYWAWSKLTGPTAHFASDSEVLLIPRGADLEQVMDSLKSIGAIQDEAAFRWLCERKKYTTKVKPGRYRIPNGMSMNALVNMLRSGEQEPVRVTFNGIRRLPSGVDGRRDAARGRSFTGDVHRRLRAEHLRALVDHHT